jgi:hypothetical protein
MILAAGRLTQPDSEEQLNHLAADKPCLGDRPGSRLRPHPIPGERCAPRTNPDV